MTRPFSLFRLNRLRSCNIFLLPIFFVFFFIYSAHSILKHVHFNSHAYDLGIFDQAIWHYSRFQAPASTIRGVHNLLGDHFHPILALLAPLFWIWNNAIMLLLAQALLFTISIAAVFAFARKRLDSVLAASLLSTAYGLFWGIQQAIDFDFHEIAFAVPAIALAICFLDAKRWIWFWVMIAVLLLTKEDLGILVIFFGLLAAAYRQWRTAGALIVVGAASFEVTTRVLIPYFAGTGGAFEYWTFTQLGPAPLSAVKFIIIHPIKTLGILAQPHIKLITVRNIFASFLFIPFFSPIIILAVPLIAERMLSSNYSYWAGHHYSATIAPVAVMAAIDGIKRLSSLFHKTYWHYAAITAALLMLAVNVYEIPNNPLKDIARISHWSLTQSDKQGYTMLNQIPATASVVAQDSIAPHLSHRQYIYELDNNSPAADYVATNFKLVHFPVEDGQFQTLLSSLPKKGYGVVYSQGSWLLWKKNSPNLVPLSSEAKSYLEQQ